MLSSDWSVSLYEESDWKIPKVSAYEEHWVCHPRLWENVHHGMLMRGGAKGERRRGVGSEGRDVITFAKFIVTCACACTCTCRVCLVDLMSLALVLWTTCRASATSSVSTITLQIQ